MIKYTAIYKDTGIIFGVITVNDNKDLPIDSPYYYIEGSYDGAEYYFDGDTPVKLPSKPSELSVFDPITKQWVINQSLAINKVLSKRKDLLIASDWTQLPNGPLTTEKQTAWATYRQELRDITTQAGYPLNVVWPIQPGSTQTS